MNDLGGQSIPVDPAPSQDEKMMATLAHALTPFTCFIAGIVIWAMKKDQSPYVAQSALQAVVWYGAMIVVAIALGVVTFCFGGLGAAIVSPVMILYAVVACIKTQEGMLYKYPLVGNLIK